ncbi:hypothetical protein TWF281_011590 [Arthrobotrys megalospora]
MIIGKQHKRIYRPRFRAISSLFSFGFLRNMAGGEPIPENPLIGSEDFPTVATQKPVISCTEPEQLSTESVPTEKMAEDQQLENSTVLVIPLEDQETIKNFWAGTMEDDTKTDLAVEITLPEPQEGEASGSAPAAPTAEPTATETPAPEASLPTPPPEENTPETTSTETREDPQPEAEVQTPEATQAPVTPEVEQTPTPPPAPEAPKYRNQIPFRKICPSCEACDTQTRCYATSCLACGDNFVLMYEDEADNEELRAKLTEAERPACNPGDEGTAYCKNCLLDWFDNCIAWPHRETLPKHEGESVLHLVVPFASDAYMQRLKDIQAYWDDKEKIFCPVPTCSAYIPRTTYTLIKEETVTRTVEKPAPVKVEETTAPEATAPATEEQNAEATVETTAETTTPEAQTETATTTTETPEPTTTNTTADEPVAEATTDANATPTAEVAEEEKKEEPNPEKETETITEIVKKEYKTRLAICSSPTCQTPVCTLCKSHFHGLDTPCGSQMNFFKEFMLAKYAKGEKKKEGEEGEENENEGNEENESEGEYDEDGEYEEYPNRFRQCVNCKNLVARHTGCDHMTCACGAAFCFYCGGEYGQYHSCLSDDDYLAGDGVGGIKITTEDGFLDSEGAAVVVNPLGVIDKEEEAANVAKWLDVVEFTEGEELKKSWKIKSGVEVEGLKKAELVFSDEENVRLAKPMKDWKGKYY